MEQARLRITTSGECFSNRTSHLSSLDFGFNTHFDLKQLPDEWEEILHLLDSGFQSTPGYTLTMRSWEESNAA